LAKPGPNLFVVGAPRCGTTALHSLLAQHPEACMSAVKEPHFFAAELNRRYEQHVGRHIPALYRSLDDYLELFAGGEEARVRGESSVYYLYSDATADAIRKQVPDARIVIMVREPVGFLHSLHGRLCSMGDETVTDFERALELEPARARGEALPPTVRVPELLLYSRYTRFAEGIERYRARFGEDRVRVVVFDDYREHKHRVWDELLDFLELSPAPLPEDEAQNPHEVPRWLWLTVRLRERVHWLEWPRRGDPLALPRRARRKLYQALAGLNWRPDRRGPIEPELRRRLEQRLAPEVERLSALLARDLAALWGYGADELPGDAPAESGPVR
jgi:hypothetical protein